jgi:hypothetical protein
MKKFRLVILAVSSSLIILSSCLNDSNTTQPPLGSFLLAQTSPDAPNVSVYINNSLFDTLHFSNYTPYVTANPGSYEFMVDSFPSTTSVLKENVTIAAKQAYSYFIIDSFHKVKSAWINDVFQVPSSDSAYVRFFNFCPNSPSPLSLVNSADQSAWFDGRTFNDQSTNPQYAVFNREPKGVYTFEIQDISGNVLKSQSVTLTGGKVYTLFAKGIAGSADTTRALSIGQLENYPQQ